MEHCAGVNTETMIRCVDEDFTWSGPWFMRLEAENSSNADKILHPLGHFGSLHGCQFELAKFLEISS